MPRSFAYIGLIDHVTEGNYRWANGDQASASDENLWGYQEPQRSSAWDCAYGYFNLANQNTYVGKCSTKRYAVCERVLSD